MIVEIFVNLSERVFFETCFCEVGKRNASEI